MTTIQREWIPLLRAKRGIIYCIWNQITNRRYIGKTRNTFWRRYSRGCWWQATANEELKLDYEKYGQDAFLVYLLEQDVYDNDELCFIENLYINQLNSIYPTGYNLVYADKDLHTLRRTEKAIENSLNRKKLKEAQLASIGVVKQRKRMPEGYGEEMSKRITGSGNPMYGKTHSFETREKIRKKALGRKASELAKAKMSLRRGALSPRSKAVNQIDTNTGQIIATYGSCREAARTVGVSSSCIIDACNGKQRMAKNYYWKYTS